MRCGKIMLKSSHRNCNTSISKSPCWNIFHIYVVLAFNLSLSLLPLPLLQTSLKISDVRRSAAATTVVENLEMSLDTPGNSSDYDPSFLSDSFVEGDDALHGELLDRMRMEMGMGVNESTSDRDGGGERQQAGGRNGGDRDVLTSADAFSEDGMTRK